MKKVILILFLLIITFTGRAYSFCNNYTGGTFLVSPTTLNFYGYLSNNTIIITTPPATVTLNGFIGSMPVVYCWSLTKTQDWIRITPADLEASTTPIPSNERSSFVVSIDPARVPLREGNYTGQINVSSTLGPSTPTPPIQVNLTISSRPPTDDTVSPGPVTIPPQQCSVTKQGSLQVSPTNLHFYLNFEEKKNPDPIQVQVGAFVRQADKNTIDQLLGQIAGEVNATRRASLESQLQVLLNLWQNNPQFCWRVTKSHKWILLGGVTEGITNISSSQSPGTFTVTIDHTQLPIYDANATGVRVGNGIIQYRFQGNVVVEADLSDNNRIEIPVTAELNFVSVPRYAAEKHFTTTDWIDVTMNIPITRSLRGALYILAEHPSLAPGQVFAYQYLQTGRPTFTLFSQWGHPVPGAEKLWYVEDVHNTPIAIPYTENMGYVVRPDGTFDYDMLYPSIPPGANNRNNTTLPPFQSPYNPPTPRDVIALIPVKFGAGLRLIGMEGDWIIRALVGDPSDIKRYNSWRELFYYRIHIHPITGRWIITETMENGKTFTYIDTSNKSCVKSQNGCQPKAYPLVLHENRGKISGYWITPKGQTLLSDATTYSKYANYSDKICTTLAVNGNRINVADCVQPSGYEIRFTEPTLMGLVEYFYNIKKPVIAGRDLGRIEGEWQYRFVGSGKWSLPLPFYGVKQEVVIPLDPNCNCYPANGLVNGVAKSFIIDTGASINLISANEDEMLRMGLTVNGNINRQRCPIPDASGIGVGGGTVSGPICLVDIVLENRIIRNVEALISTNYTGTSLLGMPFIKTINLTISSSDGTMVISP